MIYSVCADRLQIHSVFIPNVTFNAFLYSHIYPLEKKYDQAVYMHSRSSFRELSCTQELLMNRLFACLPVHLSQH